ncbi:MAG: hypothetical protein IPK14_18005 [Blastocatellia bacterium]|nr:hypothetical protein [Blastocatellia bacterium]
MQEYELEVGQGSLLEIEAAVEKFKRSSLPKIEQELMIEAQEQEVKKSELKVNGTSEIEIKTLRWKI